MKKIVIIVGPTASGKSDLGVRMAKKWSGEIISADSLQVYKYLDIGTAKTTKEEMGGIPHYGIDCVDPDADFSTRDFVMLADAAITDITSRHHLPIIVGGTFFYIRSLLHGIYATDENEKEQELTGFREKINELKESHDNGYFYEWLKRVDPKSAERLHPNDTYRIFRAIEVAEVLGKTMGELKDQHVKESTLRYNALIIGLSVDRSVLYDRINQRVDRMVQMGLVGEAQHVREQFPDQHAKWCKTLGYQYILDYLDAELSIEDAVALTKRDSRHFAKRQLTWLRKLPNVQWVDPTDDSKIERLIQDFLSDTKSQ